MVVVALLVGLGVSAPFADTPLPRIDAFIPALEGAVVLTDFITSIFLFSHCLISHSRGLLALATGYLFTALIVIPHMLTFPGAFSPTGLLGAGLQTTGWLYSFWHLGLPIAIVVYARRKDQTLKDDPDTQASTPWTICWSFAIVVALVCSITLLVTAGERFLPRLFVDRIQIAPLAHYVLAFNLLICTAALAILWNQRRSVLDQWLMVVVLTLISELVLNGLVISGRFTLGWYVSRIFTILTSTIVLVVLLEETAMLYGRLADSNAMLMHERNNRLMNLEAMAASIIHEVKQPLSAVTTNGAALLLLLGHVPPKLEKARSAAERMISAGRSIGEILDGISNLFGKAKREPSPIDVNDLALEALRILDKELTDHKVVTRVDLTSELSPVMGHRTQLQEVIVNLIQNAIEAMDTVGDDPRILRVRTQRYGGDAINVAIADTGPGIDPRKLDEIFEAFYTTKSDGMGLGLAICRMIVERHGGQLSVSPASPHGAVFQIILPQMKTT